MDSFLPADCPYSLADNDFDSEHFKHGLVAMYYIFVLKPIKIYEK